jgi:hypothetical protein
MGNSLEKGVAGLVGIGIHEFFPVYELRAGIITRPGTEVLDGMNRLRRGEALGG